MPKQKIPTPRVGTGRNGAKLWRDILSRYELESHELILRREMVRTTDQLDALGRIIFKEGLIVQGPHGSKPHPQSSRHVSRESHWRD